jgi:formamidopyrimidine-DNA glycosylase
MPELPEVETIVNQLRLGSGARPPLLGRRITGVQLLWKKTLETPAPDEFQKRLVGQAIQDLWRRGKFAVFSLSSDSLLIHLRMSGELMVEAHSAPLAPHHRLILELDQDWRLAFNDARKFGRVWLVKNPETILKDLGPEPLDPKLTPELFYQRLKSHQRQLKPLLLDQTFLAGLGNIYADEALHLAKLHPLTQAHLLNSRQAEQLLVSIRQVLQEGIRRNGATIDWVYQGGEFQNYFRVYHRTGEPCPVCGTLIQRIMVGQRGTHFCPTCQIMQEDKR